MPRGIETGGKKYLHRRCDDEKWLLEDLRAEKRTVEKYITSLRPPDEDGTGSTVKKDIMRRITVDRILALVIFGLFGSICFLGGLYLLIRGNAVVGVPGVVFGIIFIVTYVLLEKYR
jgi:hypothetical protein